MIININYHSINKESTSLSNPILRSLLWMIMTTTLIKGQISTTSSQETPANIHEKEEMLPYHLLPVYGNASLGYYYVNLYIGSPTPQPQSVIIDTGSGILALPCINCLQCGHKNHLHPPYNPSTSSSGQFLTCASPVPICRDRCMQKKMQDNCSFFIHYAEGSELHGSLVEDDIRLQTTGTNEQIKTIFGCTQKQTKLFFEQKANGIFGLAPKRESNLLEELFNRHSPFSGEKRVFSICLASNNGFMTVGGLHTQVLGNRTQPDISIPFKQTNNLYNILGILEIKMGELSISSGLPRLGGASDVIVDSGSTFTYVPQSKYNQIEKLLNKTCISSNKCLIGKGQQSICYQLILNDSQELYQQVNNIFPAFTISFNSYTLKWLPTGYMLLRNRKRNQICMGLQPLNRYLLGANWMSNRNIVFDLDSKMIHINDDIRCVQSAETMGLYLNLPDGPQLIFTNQLSFLYNINPFILILGIVILLLSIMLVIVFCFLRPEKQEREMIKDEQEQEESKNKHDNLRTNTTIRDIEFEQ